MKFSEWHVDSKAIEQGQWVTLIPATDGKPQVRVLVRGYGNSDYNRRQSELLRAAEIKFGSSGGTPSEEYQRMDLVLLCETILADWEGFTEEDETAQVPEGEPRPEKTLPFSSERALKELSNPDARILRAIIESSARNVTTRRRQATEAAIKN